MIYKMKKLFILLLVAAVVSLGFTGCKKEAEDHPTGEHPTANEHPTEEDAAEGKEAVEEEVEEHPIGEHPSGSEHPTSEHPQ